MEVLIQILEVIAVPVITALASVAIAYLNTKRQEIQVSTKSELEKKYMNFLIDAINDCVLATNQTYVDSLKEQGAFTKEKQEEAFAKTLASVYAVLSTDAIECLNSAVSDLDTFIRAKIEASVKENKKIKGE